MGSIRIIGIDPGLRNMGWGVIDVDGSRISYVDCGTVRSTAKEHLSTRLAELYEGLCAVFERLRPDEASVEETFVNDDPRSALKLGQARGVALVVPGIFGTPVAEYQPSTIKAALTGSGSAEKAQVARMVAIVLPKARIAGPDSADALAAAVTHAHRRPQKAAVAAAIRR